MQRLQFRLSNLVPPLFLSMTLGLAGPTAAQKFHLWYDEDGQAVYSQFAPGGGRESETVKAPPPPAETAAEARARLQRQLQPSEDRREDESLAEKDATKAASQAEQAERRCKMARENLEVLTGRPRMTYRTGDGELVRMTPEEQQRKRAEMEAIVERDCR
jgi:hypothetical protein